MKTQGDRRRILDLLAKNEEAISELYATYAQRLPKQAEFWIQFSKEELAHATWIRQFEILMQREAMGFAPRRFAATTLETSRAYVQTQIQIARDEPVTRLSALSLALSLENSLIEQKFFEVCTGDSPRFTELMEKLAAATQDHRQRMQAAWEEARGEEKAA